MIATTGPGTRGGAGSTGLMKDSYHFERVVTMASLVLAAITD
jgi:hypothetical protein